MGMGRWWRWGQPRFRRLRARLIWSRCSKKSRWWWTRCGNGRSSDLDAPELNQPLLHQIEQASGRCDDQVRTLTELALLAVLPDSAVSVRSQKESEAAVAVAGMVTLCYSVSVVVAPLPPLANAR